jgi:predicted amidohydrolase
MPMNYSPAFAAIQSISIRGDIVRNAARHVELARKAAKHGASLVLFPELSLIGYEADLGRELAMRSDDERLLALRNLARELRITIIVGAPLAGEDGAVQIGALSLLPGGEISVYTKKHLHPGEEKVFSPGRGGDALDIGGLRTALAVCADFTHDSHPQQAAESGAALYAASVLISVRGYDADIPILRGHAKRFAMPVLMANHGGPTGGWISAGRSAFWDADGKEIVAAPGDGECIVLVTRGEDGWYGEIIEAGD